jgi:hypothetical protein
MEIHVKVHSEAVRQMLDAASARQVRRSPAP